MEEWDQRRAESRSVAAMKEIALGAMRVQEDDAALYAYAEAQGLTVNEVVYYLNAYEFGAEEGLQALRAPDIIPADVARHAVKAVEAALDDFSRGRLPYRVTDEGTAIGLYEVQQRANGEKYLFEVCQLRLTLSSRHWHLYWMRKFDAWWPYSPPEKGQKYALRARLQQVLEDEYGCFWG